MDPMDPIDVSGTEPMVPNDGYVSDAENMPTGIAVAAGAAVVVAAAFVTSVIPASAGAVRLGLVAACLAVFAALTVNPAAVAAVGVLAFLVFDGFLVNQLGELSWHGAADERRLFVLITVSIMGLVVGKAYRAGHQWWLWRQRARWAAAQAGETTAWAGAGPDGGTGRLREVAPPRRNGQPSRTNGFEWDEREVSHG